MSLNRRSIKELLKKDNPLVLEIGSNVGNDTKVFLRSFRNIKIYCFEPDPRCIKVFKEHIKDDRCTLIEAAVSNRDGYATLHISSGWPNFAVPMIVRLLGLRMHYLRTKEWTASSSIKTSVSNSQKYPWLTFEKKMEVKTVALDSWAQQNCIDSIDFIWADVQGAEGDMIEGATNTLKRCGYFYVEYGETIPYPESLTRDETIALLKKLDFEVMPAYSSDSEVGNLLFRNKNL